MSENSFDARADLEVGGKTYEIFRLDALQSKFDVARLPFSLKVLLENLLRNEDGTSVSKEDIEALASWDAKAEPTQEIAFTPARVILQDFTGVPAVVDLAAMRDAMADLGGDASKINPLVPAELVIDHSVQVDAFGTRDAFRFNAEREFDRNQERYAFLRWGKDAFDNFAVVPPDTGIVHQVNLEYLARVVFTSDETAHEGRAAGLPRHARRDGLAHDDDQRARRARLGRRRHRGRGRDARPGDVDADAAGARLQALRRAARGRDRDRPRADRDRRCCASAASSACSSSSSARASPRCRWPTGRRSATCRRSSARPARSSRSTPRRCATSSSPGRPKERVELVEAYAKEQGLWHDEDSEEPTYSDTLELDLSDVVPSLAGPKRPQDRVSLTESKAAFRLALEDMLPDDVEDPKEGEPDPDEESADSFPSSDPPSSGDHNGHSERSPDPPSRPTAAPAACRSPSASRSACRSRSRTARRPSSTTATW